MQLTGSMMPSGPMAKTASASGRQGESAILQIRWLPRPFLSDRLFANKEINVGQLSSLSPDV